MYLSEGIYKISGELKYFHIIDEILEFSIGDKEYEIDINKFSVIVNKRKETYEFELKNDYKSIFFKEGEKIAARIEVDDGILNSIRLGIGNDDIGKVINIVISLYQEAKVGMNKEFRNFLDSLLSDLKFSEIEKGYLSDFIKGIEN